MDRKAETLSASSEKRKQAPKKIKKEEYNNLHVLYKSL